MSDELILVTGASGHLGNESVERLLGAGYRVRATVRDLSNVIKKDGVEYVEAELTDDRNWDAAAAGARYVWHLASPFPAVQPADADEVIVPAREGALRVLRAAARAGAERVVMTSSYAAVGYTPKPGASYDEDDWTDPVADLPPYIRSKVVAERAAWDFAAAHPGTELTVINPTGIFGPVPTGRLSSSVGLVRAMMAGELPVVPRQYFGVVDVRDVADLHLRAMTSPGAAGRRFIAVSDRVMSLFDLGRAVAEHLPEYAGKVPEAETGAEPPKPHISNARAKALGWRPRPPEQTIADTADSIAALLARPTQGTQPA